MTGDQKEQEMLQTLREIRDGQRQIIELLTAQRDRAEEELRRSQARIEESIGLQKRAVQTQKSIAIIAMPALVVCIGAILFLALRYL